MVDVPDTNFDETFTAYPDPGYQFIGWVKKWRGLCGGSLEPCHLATSGFSDNEALLALLDSEEVFFLEPAFLESDYIRRQQAGDVVEFEGTLETLQSGEEAVSLNVKVRDEYANGSTSSADVPALTVTRTTTEVASAAAIVTETSFWQDASGTFYDLTDEYGNAYQTVATSEPWVQSIPSPTELAETREIDYYIMYGGHTTGPVIEGTRLIKRFDLESAEQNATDYPVYRVLISDNYRYLVTFADSRRGESIVTQTELWVSPAKGVVKSVTNLREFANTGFLQREQTLSLDMVRTNY
jgi:hypothetical protein